MRSNIEAAARESLQSDASRSTLMNQLGLNLGKSQTVIDQSLDGIIAELNNACADDSKAHRLYTEIIHADTSYKTGFADAGKRASSLESSGRQLESLLGTGAKSRLSETLVKGAYLTQAQSDDVLGLVSPAVIDAIKDTLGDGSFANSAVGLKAALKASGSSVATSAPGSITTTSATAYGSTAHGADGTAVAQPSWLIRFGVPFFLLGALILGSIKFCSDAEKSKAVSEERDQLQLNLASAEAQNTENSADLVALQTDYDASQSTVTSLESDLQTLTSEHVQLQQELIAAQDEVELNTAEINVLRDDLGAASTELDTLRTLPQDAAGLQQKLISTMQERDDARSAEAVGLAKLKAVEVNRDKTQDKNDSLKFDIDIARKSIRSNAGLIAGFRSQVGELSDQRDSVDAELKSTLKALEQEKADVVRLNTEIKDLDERVGDMTSTIEHLDGEVLSLTDRKTSLEGQLQATRATLASERDGRKADKNTLTAEATQLQAQLENLTGEKDAGEALLSERDSEIAQQLATVSGLQQQVESLEAAKSAAADSKKRLEARIATLEGEYGDAQKLIETRDKSLAESTSDLLSTSDALDTAQQQIERLEKRREELLASTDELNKRAELLAQEKDSAIGEIESMDRKNTELSGRLQSLTTQNTDASGEIDSLKEINGKLNDGLEQAVVLNTNLQRDLDALKAQNGDLEQAGEVVKLSLINSEQEIAALIEERDKLQSEVAAAIAESNALKSETGKLREAIAQKLSAAGFEDVQVNSIENDRAVVITLGSNILFSAGDVTMSRQGGKLLLAVGKTVSDYPDWRIDVEGHTDSLPIGEQLRVFYPSNWELSSARASAVINHLRFASGVKAEAMSARGFADTQPVADNNSAEGRVKNRRVDIVLRR